MNYFTHAFCSPISKLSIRWVFGLIALFLLNNYSFGQTYFDMSSGNYSESFTGWSGYSTNWNGTAILATGSVPVATKTTAATTTLATIGSSTAIGYNTATSTKLAFLATGATDNTAAVACDLNLNFTGRNAGNLSFDYALIFNTAAAVGRASSLIVYYSINGTTWTTLTGPYTVYNTTGSSTADVNVSIPLPAALNNEPTVKFRFYGYNGGTVIGTPSGSRPRISLDNVSVTSTPGSGPATTIALSNGVVAAGNSSQNSTNTVLYRTDVTVANSSEAISSATFTTAGSYVASDINNLKLWYSTASTFASGSSTLLSTKTTGLGTGSQTFSGLTQTFSVGTAYLYVTADINCAATITNTINIAAIASTDFTFTTTTPTGSSFTAGGVQTINAGVTVPNNPATFTAAGNGTTGQIGAVWTVPSGCYDDFMIVASPVANTGGTPSGNGSAYSPSLTYGSGTAYGNGFVMYKGSASPQSLTGFTSGTSYSIKIFTRKDASWSVGTEVNFVTTFTNTPMAEVVVPQFMHSGGSNARVPNAYCVTLSGLTPNATYRYTSGMVLATDSATTGGAGNNIFTGLTQSANFVWGTPSLSTTFGTLTANSSGSYTGWFITEPTGNATFTAGNQVFFRLRLNDGNNGTFVDRIATTTSSSTVITMSTTAGGNNATAIRSTSLATAKDFICLYDNTAGTGRPLAATFTENDGNASVANFATFITSSVNGVAGAWGAVIPNALPNGLRRIETRSFTDGSVICSSTDADGVWTTGSINTVNPIGGSATVLVIATADAGLNCSSVILDHTGIAQTNSRIENLNSNDNIISNFRVNTSLFATTLNSISFVVGGTFTAGNVSTFKLYTSTSSSFPGGTALSSVNASALATGATITFTGLAQACAVGNRYFWITADFGVTGSGNTIEIPALGNTDFTFASNATIDTNSITVAGTVTLGILEPSIALSSATIVAANINDGTVNNVIYRANVAVTVTSASLTSASFTTGGTYVPTDVTNFKLWYSTTSTFATGTSTLLASKTTSLDAGLQVFTGLSQTIPTGTAYIYLTTDLPCATTTGNTISVDAITTSDFTFLIGTPTGSGNATGTQTIFPATPSNATGIVATALGLVGQVSVDFVLPTSCFDEIMIVVAPASNTGTPTGDGSAYNSTLNYGSGTALGNGKVVYKGISSPQIISGLTTGVTYYFKIFTRNGGLWSPGTTDVTAIPTVAPALSEVYLPQYIASGTNRVPYAYRVTLFNLTANATYRYYNSVVLTTDIASSTGAGNFILVNSSSGTFTRSTSQTLSTAGSYGTFTTDATGSYSGWFITESTGNARFTAGNAVKMRIMLNDGNNGTAVVTRLTTTNTATVISFGTSGSNVGSGIRGTSYATAKNFVMLWNNTGGIGRPLAGTMVESDGTANTSGNSYASFYSTTVDGIAGSWGTIIPNALTSGVRRIQQFGLSDGSGAVGSPATDIDGIWSSGVNTINPSSGTTALIVTITDAPLSYVTNLRPLQCGKTLPALNTVIQSSPISIATQYRFEVTSLDDNSVRTTTVSTYYFNPASQLTGGFEYGKSYSIKVQVFVGVWQAYGSACVVTTPNTPTVASTKIRPMHCGQTLPTIDTQIQASPVFGATQYQFSVTPQGGAETIITTSNYYFSLLSTAGLAAYNKAYTIKVNAFSGGNWTGYGDTCIVTTPGQPSTKLITSQCDVTFTNLTFNLNSGTVPLATKYRFRVVNGATERIAEVSRNYIIPSDLAGGYANNSVYTVDVATLYNGLWSSYGPACTVTTPFIRMSSENINTNIFEVKAFPNPFTRHFGLIIQSSSDDLLELKVYDMIGRVLEVEKATVSELSTREVGTNYPSGVYNVVVSQGDKVQSVRMIKR